MMNFGNTKRYEYLNDTEEELGEYIGVAIYDRKTDIAFPQTYQDKHECRFFNFINGTTFILKYSKTDDLGMIDLSKLYFVQLLHFSQTTGTTGYVRGERFTELSILVIGWINSVWETVVENVFRSYCFTRKLLLNSLILQ